MRKGLEAFVRLDRYSKRYKGRKDDLEIIFQSIKVLDIIKKHKAVLTPAIINGKNASFVLTISDLDTNDYVFIKRVLELDENWQSKELENDK